MSSEHILDVLPREALQDFLRRCSDVSASIDANHIRDIALATVKYLRSSSAGRVQLQQAQELETRWYDSLTKGSPDWGVYASDYYLAELWACWYVYSRKALLSIQSVKSLPAVNGIAASLGRVRRVVDLGCGCGYTTAALQQMFPDAEVIGTNFGNTMQARIAAQLSEEYRFCIAQNVDEITGATDLVFASEYFEHIQAPIQHLHDVMVSLKPRALLIANAFGTRAIGHFVYYSVNDQLVHGDYVSRLFNREMRRFGFEKMKTKLWNDRPSYWVKL